MPAYHARETIIQLLQCETSDFIATGMNPVNCKIWVIMQQHVYETRTNLNSRKNLNSYWWRSGGLQKNTVDSAIGEWRDDCEPVFVHVDDISNTYCRTVENGLKN